MNTSWLKPHLCVPMGLGLDNTREFILESLDEDETDNTPLSVVSDSSMDFMYDCMLVQKTRQNKSNHKTQRKKPINKTKTKKL